MPKQLSSFKEAQKLMARAIMTPFDGEHRDLTRCAKIAMKPGRNITALERLQIYHRQYWYRLIDCMIEDFPALRALLGEQKFDDLIESYLLACPSQSFTLRNLGSRLPDFIKRRRNLSHPKTQLAYETARLEWARTEAFDNAELPRLKLNSAARLDPRRIRLRLQPHLTLLELQYPVDDYVLAVKKHAAHRTEAVTAKRAKQKKIAVLKAPRKQKSFLAIYRIDYSVYYKRLDSVAFRLLKALEAGKSLQAACGAALKGASRAERRKLETSLSSWFMNWAELGWFASAKRS